MVKHIIIWTLKEEFKNDSEVKAGIKNGLEGLQGQIPGLLDIRVIAEGLPTSNADVMLDSAFTDAEALAGYSVHPAHVKVANENVRPFTAVRSCLDFEEK